jgi:hypothetical protein
MPNLSEFANWANIVAIPIAFAAIVVSVILYRRSRQRRALSYGLDYITSLVRDVAGEAVSSKIKVRYKGRKIENLFTTRAILKNTGDLSIRESEIIRPVTFDFGPGAELLDEPRIIDRPKLGFPGDGIRFRT